jgi:bifunctional NMN adenylyltransferase/nudix hydrolase
MEIKQEIDTKDYQIGVLIGRFHVDELHIGHKELIDHVVGNHKKVIIFLGVNKKVGTKKNPLDYATRRIMIQQEYPNVVILPLADQRYNEVWSAKLDAEISVPFGEKKTLIYGSRDSFIPAYTGKYKTVELSPSFDYSGTEVRERCSNTIISTKEGREGIINAVYARRPSIYPTVDICAYNDEGQLLLAKKPNEKQWRFVGGFVDGVDGSYEDAARREFKEETGGNAVLDKQMHFIASQKVDDWRYRGEEDSIVTTLFLARLAFGHARPSDDIAELKWIDASVFSNFDGIRTQIVPEHRDLMTKLIEKIYSTDIVPNLGKRLAERTDNVTYTIE